MKRKDFLRKMRDRRRGGEIEERQPEKRRAVDWRTLRVDLAQSQAEPEEPEETAVGLLHALPDGVRLEVTHPCWVRGYRVYEADDATRAEFQFRPVDEGSDPPPGSTGLNTGDVWQPES
jgi:hypothetical protein